MRILLVMMLMTVTLCADAFSDRLELELKQTRDALQYHRRFKHTSFEDAHRDNVNFLMGREHTLEATLWHYDGFLIDSGLIDEPA